MKLKYLYIIIPVILVGIFVYFYSQEAARLKIIEDQKEELRIAEEKAAEEKKAEAARQAAEDAAKRAKEREDRERAAEEKKLAEWESEYNKLREEYESYVAEAENHKKQIDETNQAIAAARQEKEAITREALEFAKSLELIRIERNRIDLESQRLIEIVAQKAAQVTVGNPYMPQK